MHNRFFKSKGNQPWFLLVQRHPNDKGLPHIGHGISIMPFVDEEADEYRCHFCGIPQSLLEQMVPCEPVEFLMEMSRVQTEESNALLNRWEALQAEFDKAFKNPL